HADQRRNGSRFPPISVNLATGSPSSPPRSTFWRPRKDPQVRGLRDKVAVVAGGAGGIGTATCLRLGQEGTKVVVGDLDGQAAAAVAKEITGAGGQAVSLAFDIGDEDAVRALVAKAVEEFGGLDILHANAADLSAATIGQDSTATPIDLEVFDRTMRVNM